MSFWRSAGFSAEHGPEARSDSQLHEISLDDHEVSTPAPHAGPVKDGFPGHLPQASTMAKGASTDLSDAGTTGRDSFDGDVDLTGTSPASSTISTLFAPSLYGTSPDTPLPTLHNFMPAASVPGCKGFQASGGPIAAVPPASCSNSCASAAVATLPPNFCPPVTSTFRQHEPSAPPLPAHLLHAQPAAHVTDAAAAAAASSIPTPLPGSGASSGDGSFLSLSVTTLLGCCEMLGHHMEDRSDIARQQDLSLLAQLQGLAGAATTSTPLRDASQAPLFTVAPLDVLVTRDDSGRNQFHVIEINGTGISGLTNMNEGAVEDVLRSFSELGAHLAAQLPPGGDCVVLVASSGTESYPPVSRTLHEKVLYIEALRRGFAAAGRPAAITNMTRLEKRPESMPPHGPLLVLGYMKQFRAHFMADAPTGRLLLLGRQVHAAINDRFVLNTVYQFNHCLDLHAFRGFNAGFAAGADKGVAYELYNQFFGSGSGSGGRFGCMAPSIHFRRAHTRDELVCAVQQWLATPGSRPAVIKPQGTGCGHGIEFFFGPSSWEETAGKVDRALHAVAANYNLQCGGLPFTVCEYLDTATVHPAAAAGAPAHANKAGHKFELRIVVYRSGGELRAFPSIAKVAREAFDPSNPDNKKSLINNITTSAKETAQEFLLPLCRPDTLELLGISPAELSQLCAASTAFIRFTLDTLQDNPAAFGLPGAAPADAAQASAMMQL
ncbi:hypothetical protein HXX76_000957 [Chlamydomonas incerta]|uniref:Uncharacterized protein n=1 Tax=Chlamydomonas incerta TaxID=51695 RepID=A0A835WFQ0_CHLIN|nr:hypothetical protein HXX76_000957 [Chlamydomonas incerta]|eukprot:KAG2446371.1 hypothetical protein HXX76_000957 [Chlamydomonas incerta]